MPSRLQRQFHVTGTQYISTDKVQSQTLNTGGTAENIFALGKQAQGVFYYILFIIYHNKLFTLTAKRIFAIRFSTCSAESAQRHSAPPCIGQYTAQKFICLVCICRSRVDLSAWKSALFRKISLSERSEFEIFLNAFSRFSDT